MKSPAMEKFLDDLSQQMFYGRKRSDHIKHGVCICCGGPATKFRDSLSKKEFGISGTCQSCQDSLFDEDTIFGD